MLIDRLNIYRIFPYHKKMTHALNLWRGRKKLFDWFNDKWVEKIQKILEFEKIIVGSAGLVISKSEQVAVSYLNNMSNFLLYLGGVDLVTHALENYV